MVRDFIAAGLVPPEKHFHWRGGEITRLEGFTDAVFAFAVTLLVVSLEVPKTFSELMLAIKGFVPFALCFASLVWVWYHHYIYSRRYGLQTTYVVVLNAVLLFLVLFYVYPLKFVFTLFIGGLSGGRTVPREQLDRMIESSSQVPVLMVIYSVGYAAVFVLFALLYRYAYRQREALKLNEYEALCTRNAAIHHWGFAAVGLLVATVALLLPARYSGFSGFLLMLNGVWGFWAGSKLGAQERLALERMQASLSRQS